MEERLTRTQRRAIPLILAEKSDEGDDGGQCPDRRTGAELRAEGREGMMKPLWSFSIDCEGRGMPKKSKNRPFPSTFVKLSTPDNAIFP